ncbi:MULTISPECIES: 2-oxo-4-hydroxy-4-carboxy-5-ureidoimidazoline decarboxylase [Microbacterium]|uniref:2-oxo-4-hydroxy-4-carboxy-5-ureidoimidazoline decarboxylase n=1 Tax=Microbacterium TaxID=33882 RepID=UPI00217CE81D|nr:MULTISPECIES: 2-oxo-4-hydroxy-4-carboxy-5-ureidoimidazoline decarboxylase [Microbacterium]UWF78017.1 2-oxo-4-hydroxy-4-carboxy-5-ureidoimidazoline decarboxylase [Microbacterium neungamense]WCM56195.1 2-oxo-4-hydroxy-4-carboxy-5-ureidoimidazoline decarboxylase [Microbacterium sp. EF45047]
MSGIPLDEINDMDRDRFVAALGRVFENSPWVARAAWDARPFADVSELHRAMFAVVEDADRQQVLDFLNAHPALAGKEARAGEMTPESVGEQSSAGLDALGPEEFARMAELNAAYLARHGFPFVIAVRGHTKESIFAEFERRLGRHTETERQEALAQIALISRSRLDRVVAV